MITIGVPAFNEEADLNSTIERIFQAIKLTKSKEYEIIIVNDGSTDRTAEVIRQIEKKYKAVRSIHHETNKGLGVFVKTIIKEAKYDKFCLVAGDGNVTLDTLKHYILNAYKAELVFVFIMNTEDRLASRSVLSLFYTFVYTICFNIHVKYINGAVVFPTKLMRELEIKGNRYSFAAEVAVKLLLKGCSFYEMTGYIKPNVHKSSAMKWRNLIDVIFAFFYLLYEVKIKFKSLYSKKPSRVFDEA
ncbi:glycosyltransferase family 2 protein [Leptospira ilyithenensis]|uniref:Glycosyltransferase family 2 protein n=1 Tax=Leptospira ilyithenensis TaxID=2484901 RepID=A0A4R9LM00_9LEPT|nr:glycosyltransferase family 2 protein [Leptospira ilyithenensis]TGN07974.1 glycosyltransferase family 2 protein [Leptospira ilyithenensis]